MTALKHRPTNGPPWWLIFLLTGVAIALALSGCGNPMAPRVPGDAVIVHRCADLYRGNDGNRYRHDIYRTPDGRQWVNTTGYGDTYPVARDMPPHEACPR